MEILEDTAYAESEQYYKEIQEQFRRAANDIQADIVRWYCRIGDNNDISYAAAKKLLKKNELEEFHWTVEQYIKAGEENAVDQRWMQQLENASAKVHISKLEAMKTQIQQHAEVLYSKYEKSTIEFLGQRYKDGYYRTAFEIMKGTGIGSDLHAIDTRKIDLVLTKPWAADGVNFSDRIWKDKERLVNVLHTELSQHVIRGESVDKMIENVSRAMNVSKKQAGRLIMTETAAISSIATKKSYKDLDVEQYEILATLDYKTSEICRQMDGKVFSMSDYKLGMTAPPFHPFCRSTTVPYFKDEYTENEKRAARGSDGKIYYVPADMKYEEWYRAFIEGNKQGTQLLLNSGFVNQKMQESYTAFADILIESTGDDNAVQKLLMYSQAIEFVEDNTLKTAFAYNPSKDVILYNTKFEGFDLYDLNFAQAHELSHRMDFNEIHSWENEKFVNAVAVCKQKVYNMHEEIAEWFCVGGKYCNDVALSDIISALSDGAMNDVLLAGHGEEYWNSNSEQIYIEIFANITSIDTLQYASKEEFKDFLKEIYEAYKEMIK